MKICSLLPSGTEILYALGLGDQIIGVSDLCDYPPEVKDKPVVSRSKIDVASMSSEEVDEMMRQLLASGESPYELDQEWLVRQAPDVVLTQDTCYFCEVDATTVNLAVQPILKQPQVVVLSPKTLEEIYDSMCRIGEVCGASSQAEMLVSGLRKRVEAVRQNLSLITNRPRVFSLEGVNPLVIGGHWIPDLVRLAGGRQDLYPPGCPAARVDWQQVRDYAPEKLFIDLCSSDLTRQVREVAWLAGQDGWKELPAVRSGEVYLIDHVYFSNPAPRVVQGLEILAQLTHPQAFTGLIPQKTVLKLDPGLAAGCLPSEIGQCFRPFPL
jgi:iron complex transport system substrate-binding protein